MAYPDPKGERNNRMPGKRRSCPGVRGEASRDPRDMAKAVLPEAESPEDEKAHPPERHLLPAPCSAMAFLQGRRNLRGMERCPARAMKEMSRTPKSRSDVRQGRTRDQPSGREPQGDGVPIVVVGATTHRGGRESRPQGRRGTGGWTSKCREVCVMQSAETVLDVLREHHDIVTGEPGDRKRSRRVVCPSHDYVEDTLRG